MTGFWKWLSSEEVFFGDDDWIAFLLFPLGLIGLIDSYREYRKISKEKPE